MVYRAARDYPAYIIIITFEVKICDLKDETDSACV